MLQPASILSLPTSHFIDAVSELPEPRRIANSSSHVNFDFTEPNHQISQLKHEEFLNLDINITARYLLAGLWSSRFH